MPEAALFDGYRTASAGSWTMVVAFPSAEFVVFPSAEDALVDLAY